MASSSEGANAEQAEQTGQSLSTGVVEISVASRLVEGARLQKPVEVSIHPSAKTPFFSTANWQ